MMMSRAQVLQIFGAVVLSAGLVKPVLATTATSFSSFEGEEEPTDVVHSSGSITAGDTFDNMTSPGSGDFKFYLRFNSSSWDGDRSTGNTDRQRAEQKGLGVHQLPNETFDYSHTWKTNRAGSGGFWHVFQLKAVDGDNGAPLVTDSIKSGTGAAVNLWSGTSANSTAVMTYGFSLNTYTTTRIHVKISTSGSGELRASVNGGSLQGQTGIDCYRPSATEYRPKWGSYRGVSSSSPYGNDTVEQTNVSANKVTSTSTPTPTPNATATPTPGATATPTPSGGTFSGYYKLIEQATGKALVVQSASTSNSANVILYDYAAGGTANDDWQVSSIGSGYYRIINRNSGKDMVVASASTSSGAAVIQYTYGGTATNDEWTMVDSGSGYFEIRNRNSGKNIQAMGTSNGSAAQQQTDDNAGDQRYLFISVP
jgi:hypothetical protein